MGERLGKLSKVSKRRRASERAVEVLVAPLPRLFEGVLEDEGEGPEVDGGLGRKRGANVEVDGETAESSLLFTAVLGLDRICSTLLCNDANSILDSALRI